jgi:hypothetical protein
MPETTPEHKNEKICYTVIGDTEVSKGTYCPLYAIAAAMAAVAGAPVDASLETCRGSDCELWNPETHRCGLRQ